MWENLLNEVEFTSAPWEGYRFVSKPDGKTIEKFEQTRKIKLPESYCDYALTFGPGELAGFFWIATPTPTPCEYELDRFDQVLHGPPEDRVLEKFGSYDEMKQFLFFCSTGGGDYFGWKLDSQTDTGKGEFEIYRFSSQLLKVAETFQSFVEGYILSPNADHNWCPEKTFAPVQVEKK